MARAGRERDTVIFGRERKGNKKCMQLRSSLSWRQKCAKGNCLLQLKASCWQYDAEKRQKSQRGLRTPPEILRSPGSAGIDSAASALEVSRKHRHIQILAWREMINSNHHWGIREWERWRRSTWKKSMQTEIAGKFCQNNILLNSAYKTPEQLIRIN